MLCIPKELLDKFKKAIKDGSVSVKNWNELKTSTERRAILEKIVGKDLAEPVNTLLESKMLLKDQERGMYKAIEEMLGQNAEAKAELKAKYKANLEEKNNKLYSMKDAESMFGELTSDIYARKYKTEVTLEEANVLTTQKNAWEQLDKMIEYNPDGTVKNRDILEKASAARVAFEKTATHLNDKNFVSAFFNPFKQEGVMGKVQGVMENAKQMVLTIAKTSRSLVSSFDNSFWLRQGLKALMNPRYTGVWLKDFAKSFQDIGTILAKGESGAVSILDAVRAEGYSRVNSLNGKYKKMDIDLNLKEEPFPTSSAGKLWLIGRFFRASEVAYEAGAMRLRMDIADIALKLAEKNKVDFTAPKAYSDIGEVINAMTGRGKIAISPKGQDIANQLFFSVKLFKSNVDFLTLHQGQLSSFATRMAAENLLSTVVTVGIIGGLVQTLLPDDNKDFFNPTSSNLGKIKNGNMTIDITGGFGGLVVLASKIISQKTTSATTGITSKLGDGYGSQTGMDVFWQYTENKLAPMFASLKNIIKQQNFEGKKPTITSEGISLSIPISIQNMLKMQSEPQSTQLISLIADGLGLNANVFSSTKDWGENSGVELEQFKAKVGEAKFKEANEKFNQTYNTWFANIKSNEQFKKLTDEEKKKVITNKKASLKDKVLKSYGFSYKAKKSKPLPKF